MEKCFIEDEKCLHMQFYNSFDLNSNFYNSFDLNSNLVRKQKTIESFNASLKIFSLKKTF